MSNGDTANICIRGYGLKVPPTIRTNKDPVFNWLEHHHPPGSDLFTGYKQRRVLSNNENLLTIMQPAAETAINGAELEACEIDLLLGVASVSRYNPPSDLSALHHALGLADGCWVLPQANDFSNFNAALLLADALIRAGRSEQVLICVGTNWSHHVSYRTAEAISAGDGAAAVVVGRSSTPGWQLVDQQTLMATEYFGAMVMRSEDQYSNPHLPEWDTMATMFSKPFFHVNALGVKGFKTFAIDKIPGLVSELLKKHSLTGGDITLVPYQASAKLLDAWVAAIRPAKTVDTLTEYGNMTAANVPINLVTALETNAVQTDWLLLLAIAPDMHANAMLLRHS